MHASSIAVVGMGGTGCSLLPLLSTLPAGRITLIDGDTVEAVNLARQVLYGTSDVGRAKVEAAVARMHHRPNAGPWVPVFRFIDAGNCRALLEGHQVVADCTDDLLARALIERTCRSLGIPLVSGAVHGRQVQVSTTAGPHTSHGHPGFFRDVPSEAQLGCDMRSVPAAVTQMAASLMAARIEDLLGGGDGSAGIMDLLDIGHGRWLRIAASAAGASTGTPTIAVDRS